MKVITQTGLLLLLGFCFCCKTGEPEACIDVTKINPDAMCTMQYEPVCGCDGKTYGNACQANNAGVLSYSKGACKEKS